LHTFQKVCSFFPHSNLAEHLLTLLCPAFRLMASVGVSGNLPTCSSSVEVGYLYMTQQADAGHQMPPPTPISG
jgi:hypothetical protein